MYYVNWLRQHLTITSWTPWLFLAFIVVCMGLFFYWWKHEPRSLKVGLFLNLALLGLVGMVSTVATQSTDRIWDVLIAFGLVLFVLLLIVAVYAGIVLVMWNVKVLARPRELTPANIIIIAITVSFLLYLVFFMFGSRVPVWLGILLSIIPLFITYLLFVFADFVTASILANLREPGVNYDYLIVLGAGLVNGRQVSATLGARLRTAFDVAMRQYQVTHVYPTIIVSGGRANKNAISEASAMQHWLVEEGYPKAYIIQENKAHNTFENMKYAKSIVDHADMPDPTMAYITNSYHVVRAGIYARRAGLNALGIGAATPGFFVPSGWLREFAALILLRGKQHEQIFNYLLGIVLIGVVAYMLGIV